VYENLFSIISLHVRVRPIDKSTYAAISDYLVFRLFQILIHVSQGNFTTSSQKDELNQNEYILCRNHNEYPLSSVKVF